jgi:hypothetical protein
MGLLAGVLSNSKKRRADKKWPPFYRDEAFWRGFASLYGLFGTDDRLLYTRNPHEADYWALRGDWEAVGNDMRRAMRRFEIDHAEELAGQRRLFDPDKTR